MMAAHRRLRAFWVVGLLVATLVYIPNVAAAEPKRIAGLLFGFAGALAFCLRLKVAFAWPRVCSAATWGAALLVLTSASLAWGKHAGVGTVASFYAAALFAFGASALGAQGARRMLSDAALVAGVVHALVALITQWRMGTAVGVMGNPNDLGLLLAFLIPLSVPKLRKMGVLGAVAMALMLGALYHSHSRTAQLSLAAATAVCLAMHAVRSKAICESAGPLRWSWVWGATDSWAPFADTSWGDAIRGRWWIARHALRVCLEHPFGVGAGGFAHAYLAAQGQSLEKLSAGAAARRFINADTAHASIIQVFAEQGFLGGGVLICFWFCLLRKLQTGAAAHFCAAITLLLSCFGDTPLKLPSIALFLGVLVASASLPARKARRHPGIAPSMAILVLVAGFAWVLRSTSISALASLVRAQAATQPPDVGLAQLRASLTYASRDGETRLNAGLLALSLGYHDEARTHLQISDQELANVGTKVALGAVALEQGNLSEASALYQEALRLDMGSLKAHVNLGEVCRRLHDRACAERELVAAKQVAPFHPKVQSLEDRLNLRDDEEDELPEP